MIDSIAVPKRCKKNVDLRSIDLDLTQCYSNTVTEVSRSKTVSR